MLRRLHDIWLARYAKPPQTARQAVAHLRPIVVVTGGSRGIGLQLARRFASAGHDVALVARHADPLEAAAAAIGQEFPVSAVTIALDITNAEAPRAIDARLAERGFYMDILVNSAGVGLAGDFVAHSQDEIAHLIDLNVTALTRLMRHALPGMLARARGGILNVGSLGGLVPGPYQAAYYATKAYVVSLTEAVAAENVGSGVRFTALAPGPVDTGFHAAMGSELSFYRQLLVALSPETAARAGYRGYVLGFRLVVPGLLNNAMLPFLRILPHRLLLPLVGWLLRPREPRPWNDDADDAK